MGRVLIVLVALITMATAANATTLAAGGLNGGPTAGAAFCYLFNAGSSPVTISAQAIFREGDATPLSLAGFCPVTLNAGTICRFFTPIVAGAANACKVVVDPDASTVRGTLEIRTNTTSSGTPLQTEQLR